MTFTNTYEYDTTDVDYSDPYNDAYTVGWTVSDGFEIVDFGGVQYEANPKAGKSDSITEYIVPTPLDIGESKTYRIEIRAVNEGAASITGSGYFYISDSISMYLDDEETLLLRDHQERYPELYPGTVPTALDPLAINHIRTTRADRGGAGNSNTWLGHREDFGLRKEIGLLASRGRI